MTKITGRRLRIDLTLDEHGRPSPASAEIWLDREPVTDTVTTIDLHMDANPPADATLRIDRLDHPAIGNGANIRKLP
jgi:hypothetical protein